VTQRRAYAALAALLLAGCTSHPAASHPTAPASSPPATSAAPATYDPHDPRCHVTGAAAARVEYGAAGRVFAFAGPREGVVAFGALLWRTADEGATWAAGHELPNEPTDIVPAGCRTLYAATGAEVFRSDDAAATWEQRGDVPLSLLAFVTPEAGYGLQQEPTDPHPWRLLATRDGSRTWRPLLTTRDDAVSVAADRTRLLVGVGDGILRGTGGGTQVSRVLTTGMRTYVVLAPGGPGGRAIGFRTVDNRSEYAAWYSPDLLHWRRVAGGPVQDHNGIVPPELHSLTGPPVAYGAASAMFPGSDGHRASVTVTTDGGRTLRRVFVGPAGDYYAPTVTGLQRVDPRHAYVAVTDGRPLLYRSADGGRTWTELSL
jgi:hypothetical protein